MDKRSGCRVYMGGWGTVFTVGYMSRGGGGGMGARRRGVPCQGASGGFSCLSGSPQTEKGGGGVRQEGKWVTDIKNTYI